MRYSSGKRVLLELAVIKLTKPQMEEDLSSLIQRIKILEKRLDQGEFAVPVPGKAEERADLEETGQESEEQEVVLPKAQFEDLQLIKENWNRIVKDLGAASRPALSGAQVEPLGEGMIMLDSRMKHAIMIGGREQVLKKLEEYVRANYQKEIVFQARLLPEGEKKNVRYISEESLKSKINMDIITENR